MINIEKTSTTTLLAYLAGTLMITSTLSGLGAGIVTDFYPTLRGIHGFLIAKAWVGGFVSLVALGSFFGIRADD